MKANFFIVIVLILILIPVEVFGCACCADRGFYKISLREFEKSQLDEVSRLVFNNPTIFSTDAFPDDIKGIDPIGEGYELVTTFGKNEWTFGFTDSKGNSGLLEIELPKSFVDYGVDQQETKKDEIVSIYKEWRFKARLKNAKGIFKKSDSNKNEYFLVLQGRGNACTSAEDFRTWRLEITGKDTHFAFFGDLAIKESKRATHNPESRSELIFGELKNNYSGSACRIFSNPGNKKSSVLFWAPIEGTPDDGKFFLSLNGEEQALELTNRGVRPITLKIGDAFTDEYYANDLRAIIEYKLSKEPCDSCGSNEYDVTATITNDFLGRVMNLTALCDTKAN